MNKKSDPVQKFLGGSWGSAPTQIFQNFWNCPKRVEAHIGATS